MIDLFTLVIASLTLGLVTSGLSRVDRLRPLAIILGLGSAFTLVVYMVKNYHRNHFIFN